MGRGKIEIKRIENTSNRQVTYTKRRNGIMKKAKEISVLSDAQVSVIIFSNSNKMHDFISPSSTKLVDILEKYHRISGKRLWEPKHEHLENEINRIKKENDNMQMELRHLKGEDINTLSYKELMVLEEALDNGVSALRTKQMDMVRMIRKQHEIKEEETQRLEFKLQQMNLAGPMNGHNVMENQNQGVLYDNHHQDITSYEAQMPFAFRLQPMQPNLQQHF